MLVLNYYNLIVDFFMTLFFKVGFLSCKVFEGGDSNLLFLIIFFILFTILIIGLFYFPWFYFLVF
jgi:hypothetical protein